MGRDDVVPVQQVVKFRSPRVPVAVAAVLALSAVAVALIGLGAPPRGGDLQPGMVTVAGVDPTSGDEVRADWSKPIPVTVAGVQAGTAALALDVAGATIGRHEAPITPSDLGAVAAVPAPFNQYVLAGRTTAVLTVRGDGTPPATYRFGMTSMQPATTTALSAGLIGSGAVRRRVHGVLPPCAATRAQSVLSEHRPSAQRGRPGGGGRRRGVGPDGTGTDGGHAHRLGGACRHRGDRRDDRRDACRPNRKIPPHPSRTRTGGRHETPCGGTMVASPPLIEIREWGRPARRRLLSQPLTVGRDCPGEVLADAGVSGEHLRLVPSPTALSAIDLGSRNGTLINGTALTGRAALAPGDVLRLGRSEIIVLHPPPSSATGMTWNTIRLGSGSRRPPFRRLHRRCRPSARGS